MVTENLSKGKCNVEGCYSQTSHRGLCKLHYGRLLRTGDTDPNRPRRIKIKGGRRAVCASCGIEFRQKAATIRFCSRLCADGTLERSNALLAAGASTCSIDGCDLAAEIRGFCKTHYNRGRKHGTIARSHKTHEFGRPDAAGTIGKCEGCGAEFKRSRRGSKWCSNRCNLTNNPVTLAGKAKGRQKRIDKARIRWTRTCEQCGVEFSRKPGGKGYRGESNEGRFCSYACCGENKAATAAPEKELREARQRLIWLISLPACVICGKKCSRMGKKTCSAECHKELAMTNWRKREKRLSEERRSAHKNIKYKCRHCGKEFVPEYGDGRRTYCSYRCSRRASKGFRYSNYDRAIRYDAEYERIDPLDIFERDQWRCQICGIRTPRKLRGTYKPNAPELDHRIPMSKGGPHTWTNVQCACRKCNGLKGDQTVVGQLSLFSSKPVEVPNRPTQ